MRPRPAPRPTACSRRASRNRVAEHGRDCGKYCRCECSSVGGLVDAHLRRQEHRNVRKSAGRRDIMRVTVLGFALAAAVTVFSPHANASSLPLFRGQQAVGVLGTYVTRDEDTLLDVARTNDLGYGQLYVSWATLTSRSAKIRTARWQASETRTCLC